MRARKFEKQGYRDLRHSPSIVKYYFLGEDIEFYTEGNRYSLWYMENLTLKKKYARIRMYWNTVFFTGYPILVISFRYRNS